MATTTGKVSFINIRGDYGFINCSDLQVETLFFHKSNCNTFYKHIFIDDEVSFDINFNGVKGTEAINITFIKNSSIDELRIDFKNNSIFKGFLKKIKDKYYIIDKNRNVIIPLIVAKYETNIDEVYDNNLDKLINYKIITFTNKNKIRAIKIDRQFLPECKLLVEGNKTEGLIVAIVYGGYQIKIYEKIIGFLPNILVLKSERNIKIGEFINVTCIKATKNLENVIFDLTENIDKENNYNVEKVKFIASLKPGDTFLGIIKATKSYGVFINFGLSDGLLHNSQIINEAINLSEESQKKFSKILENTFIKGIELDIIVTERNLNRITLSWDIHSERNKYLYEEINAEYKLVLQNEKSC